MKKKLLIASCLVVWGLFAGTSSVSADETETNHVTGPITRTTIVRPSFSLNPLESKEITVKATNQTKFATKILLKIKPENPNNDYFGVENSAYYFGGIGALQREHLVVNDDLEFTIKMSPSTDDKIKDVVTTGSETFKITNYSVVQMRFKVAYTTGIHFKSNGCVDYSDIDFDL